jgi:hypothetical protein
LVAQGRQVDLEVAVKQRPDYDWLVVLAAFLLYLIASLMVYMHSHLKG